MCLRQSKISQLVGLECPEAKTSELPAPPLLSATLTYARVIDQDYAGTCADVVLFASCGAPNGFVAVVDFRTAQDTTSKRER